MPALVRGQEMSRLLIGSQNLASGATTSTGVHTVRRSASVVVVGTGVDVVVDLVVVIVVVVGVVVLVVVVGVVVVVVVGVVVVGVVMVVVDIVGVVEGRGGYVLGLVSTIGGQLYKNNQHHY